MLWIIERHHDDGLPCSEGEWLPAGPCYPLSPILENAKEAETMLREYQSRWPGSQYRVSVYVRQR
jgi:hypothetical protein